VTPIAKSAIFRVLATAPGEGPGIGDFNFLRPQAGALVRAVAKRLAF